MLVGGEELVGREGMVGRDVMMVEVYVQQFGVVVDAAVVYRHQLKLDELAEEV